MKWPNYLNHFQKTVTSITAISQNSHKWKNKGLNIIWSAAVLFVQNFQLHPIGMVNWVQSHLYNIGINGYTRNEIARYFRLQKHDHFNLGNTWFKPTWPLQITCLKFLLPNLHACNLQAYSSRDRAPRLNIFLFNYFYLII